MFNWLVQTVALIAERLRDFDMKYHFDVIADAVYKGGHGRRKFYFDIKDVEDRNAGTGNYTVVPADRKYCLESDDEHWLAFKLNITDYGDRVPFNTFVCVKATEALDRANLADGKGETCYSLLKIWENCQSKFVAGSEDDLKRFFKYHARNV